MFSAGLFIPAAVGSQGHVSSHAERLQDLPLSRKCNVTRYFVGGVAVRVRAHSPCSGRLVCGTSASRRLSEATRPLSESNRGQNKASEQFGVGRRGEKLKPETLKGDPPSRGFGAARS